MKISKALFKDALAKCHAGAFTSNAMVEYAENYVFTPGFISSFGGTVQISVPLPGWESSCAVRAQDLEKCIAKLKAEELDIDITESSLRIVCGRAKAELALTHAPEMSATFEDLEWKALSDNFIEATRDCIIANNKTTYDGVAFWNKENGWVMGTDSTKICAAPLHMDIPSFWISTYVAKGLTRAIDDPRGGFIALSLPWVHVKDASGTVYSCLCKDHAQYPFEGLKNYYEASLAAPAISEGTLPKDLTSAAQTARAFVEGNGTSGTIELTLSPTEVCVKASSARGNFEESIEWSSTMESPVTVYVDPTMLDSSVSRPFKLVDLEGTMVIAFLGAAAHLIAIN